MNVALQTGRWPTALLRRRPEVVDAAVVAVGSAAVYALHGFHGRLDRDLAVFVYGAEQVAHGVPPYVGNFNTVGPLADAVPGAAVAVARLVGAGPVIFPRGLFWLLSAGCCVLMYLLGRQVIGSRAGGFLAATLFLPFGSFLTLATDGPREKTLMVLFLVAALIQLCRRRWATAGVLTGLATLTWQPVLLPLVVSAVAAAALTPRRWRAGIRFLAGGLATAALAAAFFALAGALPRALEGFVVANLLWVHQPGAFSAPGATWRILWGGYHAAVFLALLGPIVLLVAAARGRRPGVVITAAGGAAAVVWTASVINGAPDLFVVLPFGALGSALLVHALAVRVGARGFRAGGGLLVPAVCAAAVVAAAATAVATRAQTLGLQATDVQAVLHSLPRGSRLATINAPEPLVLSGRTNPTPYLILDPGETGYLDHNVPGGTAGYVESLMRRDPALLAVGIGADQGLITRLVHSEYRRAGHGAGWEWWVARDLGRQTRQRVHRATENVLHPRGCEEVACRA